MASLADVTLDVLDMLYGQAQVERPTEDTLVTAVSNATDTTWQFTTPTLWSRGDYAEYFKGDGSAGEVVVLVEDHPTGSDVEVRRGQRRTTAAASFAAGDVFLKNPPYTHTEIQRAITEVIDNDLAPHVWYRSKRTLTPIVDRHYYDLADEDFQIEEMYQIDVGGVNALDDTFSYDESGGAAEDLWESETSTAHGLVVGDHVQFTTAGTNATGYAIDTDYWVVSVPSTTSFTISATKGGSAVAGTGDGTGWVVGRIVPEYIRFPSGWWEPVTDQATPVSSTGRTLLVRQWQSTNHTIYYTARSKPVVADIASFPGELIDMLPWGAVARLVGGAAIRERHDPTRTTARRQGQQPSQAYADSEFFRQRFLEMRTQYRRMRMREKIPPRRLFRGVVSESTFYRGHSRRSRYGR